MKKLVVILAIILVIAMAFTACAQATPTPTPAPTTPAVTPTQPVTTPTTPVATTPAIKKGGILRYVYPYSPTSTPGWPNDRSNVQRMWTQWTIFEPLIKMQADGKPGPWLATSWEWGPQNTYVTFTLRKGVKFHDGTNFTSEAVKMEGDLIISTKESNTVTWDRWEIIDDYTVRLYLKHYQNDFWGTVAGINMCFFSPTAYKARGEAWMKENPIGTGPFKFKSFEKDVSLKFVKNPDYWQPGKPYVDEIHMITVKEALTQQATMQAGDGDILALQQGKILADMKALGFTVLSSFGGTDFIIFDTKNADSQYSDVRVRMAIEHALNKQDMVDALGFGFLVKNNQMPPPNNPSHNRNLPSRDYDPAKAKALLAEAGFPNGFQAKMITVGAAPKALAIQEYLKAVGIRVTLESVDNAKFWDYNMRGWSGMLDTGFAVGTNFPAWLRAYFPPVGIFSVSSKIPDEIVAKIEPALREIDPVKAKAMSDEILKMVYENATFIPIYSNAMGYILAKNIKGSGIFEFVDFSVWSPENVWIDK
ncbi:MAG TPA: ABC transporter substrate-binding protein [Dehalococcoidales bacterium]|nr:ABC transporter substrate-binding protein [Dehalococcoidales bacterium]